MELRAETVPQLVTILIKVLGAPIIAIIAGVKKTSIVREWAKGESIPDVIVQKRLRSTLQVINAFDGRGGDDTIRAWISGTENSLIDEHNDGSPALFLRDNLSEEKVRKIIAAAQRFAWCEY